MNVANESMTGLAERAAELRAAFDGAFAAPLRADAARTQDFLAIRVGASPCAIRLSEVTGLFVDRKVTRVPGSNAALIGIAGFRGALVPVYSLRPLLPSPRAGKATEDSMSATRTPRWLVIAAAAPVALAFDLFEGHLRVTADAILPAQSHAQMRGCAPDFVRAAGAVRPVLHLASVIAALGTAEQPVAVPKEE